MDGGGQRCRGCIFRIHHSRSDTADITRRRGDGKRDAGKEAAAKEKNKGERKDTIPVDKTIC